MNDVPFASCGVGDLPQRVGHLRDTYGQRKPMGSSALARDRPHFFLLRSFFGANDLLIIMNTKRCRYNCDFCTLPQKSSRTWINDDDVVSQFLYVASECRHALSIVQRVTLSNEGSVLDEDTFGPAALNSILEAISSLKQVRRVDLETRLEFVNGSRLEELSRLIPRAELGILTGFETLSERIRVEVLRKRQSIDDFLSGLDCVAAASASLTAYVLFKPDPEMTDKDAYEEAGESIRFLMRECEMRGVRLQIRLNPMYCATGSKWERKAAISAIYAPPRLTQVMALAEEVSAEGAQVYIGLSSEGLANGAGTYLARSDYSPALIKYVKLFNDHVIT
jgi:radical SAM enzyme (TIGR01210 family)